MSNSHSSRRSFLKHSATAVAAGAVLLPSGQSVCSAQSPNDRPRFASIGIGGMGRGDAKGHRKFADLVAICDVDRGHAEKANKDPGIGDGKAQLHSDYREVLDRTDVDVVSIATPDHWHVKIAIEALEAGKHVFCQKPLTLTLEENQLIRAACRKPSLGRRCVYRAVTAVLSAIQVQLKSSLVFSHHDSLIG
ncbi:MAG: Gfo/Idh/MocA family oxidoreductase [Fuerstiella sp.]|nr:Gfo/Idh/MocA family oxidoreductase [Fuerstiella sp.]